jgi:hypothetical protein
MKQFCNCPVKCQTKIGTCRFWTWFFIFATTSRNITPTTHLTLKITCLSHDALPVLVCGITSRRICGCVSVLGTNPNFQVTTKTHAKTTTLPQMGNNIIRMHCELFSCWLCMCEFTDLCIWSFSGSTVRSLHWHYQHCSESIQWVPPASQRILRPLGVWKRICIHV